MKYLLLNGHGIKVNVDSGKLIIHNGRSFASEDPEKLVLYPKAADYENIVVYGYDGYITFEAMRWLTKMNIQLTLLNWDGRLLTSILPLEAKQTKLKFAQYKAYESPERLNLAKNIIHAKFKNSKVVLEWLKKKYPETDSDIDFFFSKLKEAKTVPDILIIEARAAGIYWKELSKMFTKFEFRSRDYSGTCRPFGAVDPINALFNYGYSLLESQCHRAINAAGMDTHVGFVHEIIAGKTPLVYDLQEPFRCLIDMAIVSGLEKNVFKKSDFIRTENYNIRLRPSSAKKLVKEVGMVFNDRVNYRGGERTWTHVIMMKANELGLYLQGKRKSIDFSEPAFIPERTDDHELRQKILSLSQSEANKLGIGKSSLHYLRKHAKSDRPFKVYKSVKKRLVSVEK